jgi:hypothetical protein
LNQHPDAKPTIELEVAYEALEFSAIATDDYSGFTIMVARS